MSITYTFPTAFRFNDLVKFKTNPELIGIVVVISHTISGTISYGVSDAGHIIYAYAEELILVESAPD